MSSESCPFQKKKEKKKGKTLSRSSESFSFQDRSPLEIQWQSDWVVNLGHSCCLLSCKEVKSSQLPVVSQLEINVSKVRSKSPSVAACTQVKR